VKSGGTLGCAALLLAWGAQLPVPLVHDEPLPDSQLALRVGNEWQVWWRSSAAPARWQNAPLLRRRVAWRRAAPGLEWGELFLRGTGEAWRTKLVVARINPSLVRLQLDTALGGGHAAWRLDRAPRNAILAVNAGQFFESLPWGWVRLAGEDFLSAAHGPLASTLAISRDGSVALGSADSALGVPPDRVSWAFQSYPTLLRRGEVPLPLRAPNRGIDVGHRDARLAIGLAADGTLIIAMTRFDALGQPFGMIPFGLTTPEMAAVMGALGATDAVLLDGGISAQMLIRGPDGEHRWPGIRAVPLALIVYSRS
jgi:hypothetical protein